MSYANTFVIHTLGCKVNQYESRVIHESLVAAGLSPVKEGTVADICIINSCAVTAESERKTRQIVRRTLSENPDCYMIVTGCYAQLSPDELASIDGVGFVCGNRTKLSAADAAIHYAKTGVRRSTIGVDSLDGAPFERSCIHASERTRAYVKIEDGCDSKCAYCTIKNARGPVRSKPLADVVSEIEGLAAVGYREVVLTGIEISAWGRESAEGDLADLIRAIGSIDTLARIRLGSLDPALLTPAFVDRIADIPALAPHFHLSLQSGCDRTLFSMRRRYNCAMVRRNVAHIREVLPDACFTADTIVGFPGESEEDFAETLGFIEELGLIYNHIFPFSRRPNTEADRMEEQLTESVKSERLHRLEAVRDRSTHALLSAALGRNLTVLCEEYDGSHITGHTASFMEVTAPASADLRRKLVTVRADSVESGRIVGKIVDIRD